MSDLTSDPHETDYISKLPSELWLEILCNLTPRQDLSGTESRYALSNVSTVCRYFLDVARSLLFKNIEFSAESEHPGRTFSFDYHLPWCKYVLANHAKPNTPVSSVQSYTLSRWATAQELRGESDPSISGALREHIAILPLLSNLQDLCLTNVMLEVPDVEGILTLGGLHALRIIRCKFQVRTRPPIISGFTVQLKTFEFIQTYSTMDDFFEDYIPDILPTVVSPSLRKWKTDDQVLARNLLSSDNLRLEEVQIRIQQNDLPLLSEFLNKTPSIVDLKIVGFGRRSPDNLSELDLRPTALPKLRALRCPCHLLPSFLPSRPIRKLHIYHHAIIPRGIRHFDVDEEPFLSTQRAASVVDDLAVSMSIYDNVPLEKYFPTLKSLRIIDDRGLPMAIKSHNPKVQELDCSCHQEDPTADDGLGECGLDLPTQREWVHRLQSAFPDATRIVVMWNTVQWRRSNAQSSDWTPVVTDRDNIRARILSYAKYPEMGPLRIVDEDECLAKLFLPHEMTPDLQRLLPSGG